MDLASQYFSVLLKIKITRMALLASFENGRKLFSVNYTVRANEVLRISETVYLSDRCLGDKFVSTGCTHMARREKLIHILLFSE